ncbi:MAG: type VI secretion system tube protein Hcp [Gammaproteobacteria bacterium]|nr:type VI secretion system tube protein Hcp [Gammaproteobacteria bacterium]MYB38123.1 type VI secretion system tube protein Hcp [Gammaproteobacteria bacterium]
MAAIVVHIPSIPGESLEGEGKIDALGVRESVEILASGFSPNAAVGRSAGTGAHSDIEIIKYRDKASPKLAEAAANNVNLNKVTVELLTGPGGDAYMTYELENAYVARMEHETLDESNTAFLAHYDPGTRARPAPTSAGGVTSVAAQGASTTGRDGVLSLFPQPRGNFTEHEVERVWLNATKVTWTYRDTGNSINETAEARLV